jgi:hypothetical protein
VVSVKELEDDGHCVRKHRTTNLGRFAHLAGLS